MSRLINASKIWGVCDCDTTTYVRVKNGVANFTDKRVLIRVEYPDTPDGLYDVTVRGKLRPVHLDVGFDFPDIDLLEPDFDSINKLYPLHLLDQKSREYLTEYCRKVGGTVVLTSVGVRTAFPEEGVPEVLPVNLNIPIDIAVNAKYLEIVFSTFKEDPMLYVVRESRPTAPLVIGANWRNCALISPSGSRWRRL